MEALTLKKIKEFADALDIPKMNKQVLWMNDFTIKELTKSLEHIPRNATTQFSGVEIRSDNSIPDYHFETDIQRRKRLTKEHYSLDFYDKLFKGIGKCSCVDVPCGNCEKYPLIPDKDIYIGEG